MADRDNKADKGSNRDNCTANINRAVCSAIRKRDKGSNSDDYNAAPDKNVSQDAFAVDHDMAENDVARLSFGSTVQQ